MKKIFVVVTLLFTHMTPVHASYLPNCDGIKVEASFTKGTKLQCLANSDLIAFESLRGPMIVNFWGSWCGPCLDEIPYLRAFHKKYPKTPLIGVDVEERTKENGRAFAMKYKMTWPHLYDATGSTRKISGMGVPVTLFIDEKGKIVHRKIGVLRSARELEVLAKKYLKP